MPISKMLSYEEVTQKLEQYVQECAVSATDTTHGYKKREAALRADGAIRLWMTLFMGSAVNLTQDAQNRFEQDLLRLRHVVQNISLDDPS